MCIRDSDIDAAALQHRAMSGQVDLVEAGGGQHLLDPAGGAGQKASAHAIGLGAKAQIEAGGLDLACLLYTSRCV